jgi:hypothetical protein
MAQFTRFDHVNKFLKVTAPSFVTSYAHEVNQMKQLFVNYVSKLDTIKTNDTYGMTFANALGIGIGGGIGNAMNANAIIFSYTPEGYPVFPSPLDFIQIKKKPLEIAYSEFFRAHYGKKFRVYNFCV